MVFGQTEYAFLHEHNVQPSFALLHLWYKMFIQSKPKQSALKHCKAALKEL